MRKFKVRTPNGIENHSLLDTYFYLLPWNTIFAALFLSALEVC